MQYRCYFFGAHGQLVGADTIHQESDSDAQRVARELFAQRAHAVGYELRQDRRCLDKQDFRAAKSPRAA